MWFKVDSGFLRHPKVRAAAAKLGGRRPLGRLAAVWLELGLYGADYLSDGFVPDAEIDELKTEQNGREVVDAMIHAQLAHREPGGIRLHDWEDYQPSAADYKRKKKNDRDRKRAARNGSDASVKSPRGQHADVHAESEWTNRAAGPADSDEIPARSRARDPVPSRPQEPEGQVPRGLRRAEQARMTLDEVDSHLRAAVHALIESGGQFVDSFGEPDDSALLLELKDIAARDLGASWQRSDELGRIVDGVIGERRERQRRRSA